MHLGFLGLDQLLDFMAHLQHHGLGELGVDGARLGVEILLHQGDGLLLDGPVLRDQRPNPGQALFDLRVWRQGFQGLEDFAGAALILFQVRLHVREIAAVPHRVEHGAVERGGGVLEVVEKNVQQLDTPRLDLDDFAEFRVDFFDLDLRQHGVEHDHADHADQADGHAGADA
ncbi:hypothetical protein GALL_404720 [mine drainage metagenome]|uniref:Uncharacterized protein n=1 Tax=mine drainage metagenome TaxID=410659 RepID=A0A1J5QD28_9ZZZZ